MPRAPSASTRPCSTLGSTVRRDSVSPVESVTFDGLPVEGIARGSCVTLYVHGSNAVTTLGQRTMVAKLKVGCEHAMAVRTLFGVNGSSWDFVEVDTNGYVILTYLYGSGSATWGTVSCSVTYTR